MRIWLYGKPFSGKTTFVSGIPNSIILSTDGNADYLFDSKNIINIKTAQDINNFVAAYTKGDYGKKTIIYDVTEHLEDILREYALTHNKMEHESDGAWGKGWKLVEDAIWYTLSKLARLSDDVVFISHESEYTTKDAIGREITNFRPALSEKYHDRMTGLMKVVCRIYKTEISLNNEIVSKYYISIGDNANELSGTRLPLKSTKIQIPQKDGYKVFLENIEGGK